MKLPKLSTVSNGYVFVDNLTNISYVVKEYNGIKVWDILRSSSGVAMSVDEIPMPSLSYFGSVIKVKSTDVLYICESSEDTPTSDDECYWIRMFDTHKSINLPKNESVGFRYSGKEFDYELVDSSKNVWYYGSKDSLIVEPYVEPAKEFGDTQINNLYLKYTPSEEFISYDETKYYLNMYKSVDKNNELINAEFNIGKPNSLDIERLDSEFINVDIDAHYINEYLTYNKINAEFNIGKPNYLDIENNIIHNVGSSNLMIQTSPDYKNYYDFVSTPSISFISLST